jgi:thiamine biosynthesis lipoprotein
LVISLRTRQFLFALFFLVLGWFAYQQWQQPVVYHSQSYVFGTMVELKIVGVDKNHARQLSDQILLRFQDLQERLHPWKPISKNQFSELQLLNQAVAKGESISVAPDIAEMLQEIKSFSIQSDGLFNPAIGHLIQAWGFQRDEFSPVEINQEKIAALVNQHPSMADIEVSGTTVSSKNLAVNLDFGGYAKGYALDLAYQILKKNHVENALINIGGNVMALGKNGEKPWRVGIQHPRKPEPIATLELPDGWAIGTSGDYQRYFELNGKRFCHLIDPRTGYPVQHTQAVTVLIPPQSSKKPQAGTLSDMASKPIFIESALKKAMMVNKLSIDNVMVIDANGQIFITPAFQKKLQWVASHVPAKILQ